MKGTHMSRTIETIAAHLVPVKRPAPTARAKQLSANWQNGFESGGQVQRKLRLTFTDVAARQPEH
jgi:GTP cyclohydrolase FolE2